MHNMTLYIIIHLFLLFSCHLSEYSLIYWHYSCHLNMLKWNGKTLSLLLFDIDVVVVIVVSQCTLSCQPTLLLLLLLFLLRFSTWRQTKFNAFWPHALRKAAFNCIDSQPDKLNPIDETMEAIYARESVIRGYVGIPNVIGAGGAASTLMDTSTAIANNQRPMLHTPFNSKELLFQRSVWLY